MNHKLVFISGFPRTGSTFLLTVYHILGYTTGFNDKLISYLQNANHRSHGGAEFFRDIKHRRDISEDELEIVKHPYAVGEREPWRLKCLTPQEFQFRVLTVRNLTPMIESQIERLSLAKTQRQAVATTILNKSSARIEHERLFKHNDKRLRKWLGEYIEVEFPRSVEDFDYFWERLGPTFLYSPKRDVRTVWEGIAKPEYVKYR